MNAADVLCYTYDADYHCTDCAIARYGEHPRSPVVHRWAATPDTGEAPQPVFGDSEWYDPYDDTPQTLCCGTCGDVIDTLND